MPRVVGTLNETDLHRRLKVAYAGRGGRTEVELGGFVADGVSRCGALIEVQSGGFGRFAGKARKLAALGGGVKVVYPVIVVKRLEVFAEGGEKLYERKSWLRGSAWDVFGDLVHDPELPRVPGLELELAMVDVAEERVSDGKGARRRGGLSIRDRRLLELREGISLAAPADFLRFVPFARGEEFTSGDLGKKAGIRTRLAGKALYVLARLGIVERLGKRRNSHLYRLRITPRAKSWKGLRRPKAGP